MNRINISEKGILRKGINIYVNNYLFKNNTNANTNANTYRMTYAMLQSAYSSRWGSIAAVVKDLSRQVSSYNNLQEFFSALRLDGDFVIEDAVTNSNKNKDEGTGPSAIIWVMTMHAAKGLEFDEVLLPFWTEGNTISKPII